MDNLRTTCADRAHLQCRATTDAPLPSTSLSGERKPTRPRGRASKVWPALANLRLSARERRLRSQGIGGSDANIILSGDTSTIRDLWLEKRGEASPPDLSDKLSVMLGCWTEAFNRQWYEQLSGEQVTEMGKSFACARYNWRRCTVDGRIKATGAVWEAKHTSAFAKPQEVLERYMPQLQHQYGCGRGRAGHPLGDLRQS